MKKYFEVDPEVPGYPSEKSEAAGDSYPLHYKSLHFVFQGWMGDHIVTSWPVYLVTSSLAEAFKAENLSGFEIDSVEVAKDSRFVKSKPDMILPPFVWLKVNGVCGESDFFLDEGSLVVSEDALKIVLASGPTMLMYGPFEEE